MKNKYFIFLFIILILTMFLLPVVEATDINVFYKIENNDQLNSPNLAGIYIQNKLNKNYLFTASGATGNLIGDKKDCQQFNVNMYKKITFKSDFNYYLGAGYNYLLDDSDELKKNLMFFTLKGINQRQAYSVISEICYAPLGIYSFGEQDPQNMNAWNIKLKLKTYITEKLNISLEGSVGAETYQDFSINKNGYSIGLGWDL